MPSGNGGADRFVVDAEGDKVADFSQADDDTLDFSQLAAANSIAFSLTSSGESQSGLTQPAFIAHF